MKKQRKKYLAWVANRRESREKAGFDAVASSPEPRGVFSTVVDFFTHFFRRFT